ncbi:MULTISPECIES: cation transporter dimerization domain-containing protein [unclassified Lysinibacillus]
MEKSVDQELLDEYEATIHEFNQVQRIDKIRAREHGHYKILDLRLSLNHDLTIIPRCRGRPYSRKSLLSRS